MFETVCLLRASRPCPPCSELVLLVDVSDVNYTPDGHYRGGTVTNFKDTSSAATQGTSWSTQSVGSPPPEIHRMGANQQNLALPDTMTAVEPLRNALGTIQALYNCLEGSIK